MTGTTDPGRSGHDRPLGHGAGGRDAGELGPADGAARERAAHLVALSLLPGMGPATLWRCHVLGPAECWAAVLSGRGQRHPALADLRTRIGAEAFERLVVASHDLRPDVVLARHLEAGRRVLVHGGPGYPDRLLDDPAPPAVLFAEGDPDAVHRPAVAVVGTRNATRQGRDLARRLGADLARAGVAVVSGLALGIDGAAHRGTLDEAGPPDEPDRTGGRPAVGPAVGVVASGLDLPYPRRHAELHREVAASGLLLSETPLGVRPLPWRFPARNRIIAALADAVVVVESRSRGGSMLTVGEALDRGVPVMAVPGHPTAPAAAGTNDLLFDGACPVRGAADVLGLIGITAAPPPRTRVPRRPAGAEARAVHDLLAQGPASLAEVVARSGLGLDVVADVLVGLETDGWVARSGGWFEVAGRSPATDPVSEPRS